MKIVHNCYSCSKYYECENKVKAKWFPCSLKMLCFKSLVIDKEV